MVAWWLVDGFWGLLVLLVICFAFWALLRVWLVWLIGSCLGQRCARTLAPTADLVYHESDLYTVTIYNLTLTQESRTPHGADHKGRSTEFWEVLHVEGFLLSNSKVRCRSCSFPTVLIHLATEISLLVILCTFQFLRRLLQAVHPRGSTCSLLMQEVTGSDETKGNPVICFERFAKNIRDY